METSIYDLAGGMPAFETLVEAFYVGIETDELLRPMYPEELTAAKRRLTLFLCQYFGGPETYSQERGHPRLRMRHAAFVVDENARDHWIEHMLAAMNQSAIPEPAKSAMVDYFVSTANFLVNVPRQVIPAATYLKLEDREKRDGE